MQLLLLLQRLQERILLLCQRHVVSHACTRRVKDERRVIAALLLNGDKVDELPHDFRVLESRVVLQSAHDRLPGRHGSRHLLQRLGIAITLRWLGRQTSLQRRVRFCRRQRLRHCHCIWGRAASGRRRCGGHWSRGGGRRWCRAIRSQALHRCVVTPVCALCRVCNATHSNR